jgi:thymidylate kinase
VRFINEIGLDGIVPQHVFVLDVEPDVALARQDGPDRIGREGVDFQSAVRSCYLDLAESEEKVVVLDGALSVEEMADRIMQVVM